jgi:hypothetical protein
VSDSIAAAAREKAELRIAILKMVYGNMQPGDTASDWVQLARQLEAYVLETDQ